MDRDGLTNFLFGLGVGIGIGILFAPKSGDETRSLIKDKANEGTDYLKRASTDWTNTASDLLDKGKSSASDLLDKGKSAISKQKDNLNDAVEAGKQAYRDKVQPTASDLT